MFSFKVSDEIELRLLQEQHAEEVLALLDGSRNFLAEWQPNLADIKTLDNAKDMIRNGLQRFAQNKGFLAGIEYNGQLAGTISCNEIDWVKQSVIMGYWLGEQFQGKGLVTQSCRAIIDYAFNIWKLNRIEINVASGNLKSRAIPERLGFVQEGVLRQRYYVNGRFEDGVIYGLLASDWQKEK